MIQFCSRVQIPSRLCRRIRRFLPCPPPSALVLRQMWSGARVVQPEASFLACVEHAVQSGAPQKVRWETIRKHQQLANRATQELRLTSSQRRRPRRRRALLRQRSLQITAILLSNTLPLQCPRHLSRVMSPNLCVRLARAHPHGARTFRSSVWVHARYVACVVVAVDPLPMLVPQTACFQTLPKARRQQPVQRPLSRSGGSYREH